MNHVFILIEYPDFCDPRPSRSRLLRQLPRGHSRHTSTIALALATNPFLRRDSAAVIAAAEMRAGPAPKASDEVFAVIREWKNTY